jgi:hypothetical protein
VLQDVNNDFQSQLQEALQANPVTASNGDIAKTVADSMRQPVQEAFKLCFREILLPSFDKTTKAMFQQVNDAFSNAVSIQQEQSTNSQRQLTQLVQDTLDSVKSHAQQEKKDFSSMISQMKENSSSSTSSFSFASSSSSSPSSSNAKQQQQQQLSSSSSSSSSLPENFAVLNRWLDHQLYDEAFTSVLETQNIESVLWLCSRIDPRVLFTTHPLPVHILLSLCHQLTVNVTKETQVLRVTWLSVGLPYLQQSIKSEPELRGYINAVVTAAQKAFPNTQFRLL